MAAAAQPPHGPRLFELPAALYDRTASLAESDGSYLRTFGAVCVGLYNWASRQGFTQATRLVAPDQAEIQLPSLASTPEELKGPMKPLNLPDLYDVDVRDLREYAARAKTSIDERVRRALRFREAVAKITGQPSGILTFIHNGQKIEVAIEPARRKRQRR